jgi:hypothetical protein
MDYALSTAQKSLQQRTDDVILLASILASIAGFFNVYRDRVNPRAKISDFIFLVAGVAVIANLVSILAFRVRLF